MKIFISYPPIGNPKGVPLLSQNRQFQWFSEPTYIYPIIPAYAATLCNESGYDVKWDDSLVENKTYIEWLQNVEKEQPNIMMIETKTPVVKYHWKCINDVKNISSMTKVVLVGDHVTALPRESMINSKVDFVLEGGDYDFLLLNLVNYLSGRVDNLEAGIWFKENKTIKTTGIFQSSHDLNTLPFIDRDLTSWKSYAIKNGNFRYTPGTYTMVGRDCWWRKDGGCTFCSWPTLYPSWRTRHPELLVNEIQMLIEKYKIRDIFDDTGSFPVGNWLNSFCELMIERGLNDKISLSCNMRFGILTSENYKLMKKAGFRMLLFGLESACQSTLDRLNKGITVNNIVDGCKQASKVGLDPHITVMVGYPWETKQDAMSTLNLAKHLLDNGWVKTLQSTIIVPYPGTALHDQAIENDWFRMDPLDYEKYDMTEPMLITPDMDPKEVMQICDDIYKLFFRPKYIIRRLMKINSLNDVIYSMNGLKKVIGHIKDFSE